MRRTFFVSLMGIVIAAGLSGCSSANADYTVTSRGANEAPVDPRLLPYYQFFARAAGQAVPAIRMTIGTLEDGVAGKCYRPGEKAITNQVGEIFFGEATDPEKRVVISARYFKEHLNNREAIHQVVFHELGHCLLGRDHDERWMAASGREVPRSIMYSRSFGEQIWYKALMPYYEKEMFGQFAEGAPLKLADAPLKTPHDHGDGWQCGTRHDDDPELAQTP